MILFDEKMERVIKRNALGLKELVIDKDITNGMEVTLNTNNETRQLFIDKATDEEIADRKQNNVDDIIMLLDEFSPVKNLKDVGVTTTKIELMFHGSLMYVKLVSGALFVKNPTPTDGDCSTIMAYKDAPELEAEGVKIDTSTQWFSIDKLKSYCTMWGLHCKSHVEDYLYEVELSLDKSGVFSIKPTNIYDISLGELAYLDALNREREMKAEVRKVEKIATKCAEEDDYVDEGEGSEYDEDEDYDDYEDYN